MQSGLFQLLSSFCLSGKTVDIYHSSKQKKEEAFKHLNVSVYIFKYLVVISQWMSWVELFEQTSLLFISPFFPHTGSFAWFQPIWLLLWLPPPSSPAAPSLNRFLRLLAFHCLVFSPEALSSRTYSQPMPPHTWTRSSPTILSCLLHLFMLKAALVSLCTVLLKGREWLLVAYQ